MPFSTAKVENSISSFAGKFSTEDFDQVLCNLISFYYVKDRILLFTLSIVLVDIEHMLISPKSSFSSAPRISFVREKIVCFLCGVPAMCAQGQLAC